MAEPVSPSSGTPAQITTGIRSVLSTPWVYSTLQNLLGGKKARLRILHDYIRPQPEQRLLDIGCGPAEILELLPASMQYEGFDLNPDYIANARQRYGSRGAFRCQRVAAETIDNPHSFDVVIALGLLHHLADEEAIHLFKTAHAALRHGGRFITIDPCYTARQNPIARFIIRKDRGQMVRTPSAYEQLARTVFQTVHTDIRTDLLNIPYTHCILQSTAP